MMADYGQDDLDALRKRIAALSAMDPLATDADRPMATGLAPGAYGPPDATAVGMTPRQMVAQAAPIAAPSPVVPQAATVTKVVQVPVDAWEMDDAKSADADARSRMMFETGTRQLIAGLTRTPQAATLSQPGTAVTDLQKARMEQRANALRALEAQNLGEKNRLDARRLDNEALRTQLLLHPPVKPQRELTDIEKAEIIARTKLNESKAVRNNRPPTPKAAAPVALPDEVPFEDGKFVYAGDPNANKEIKLDSAKKVRASAAQWGLTLTNLSKLEGALAEFAKNPNARNRALLQGPALAAAGATNAAIGQGAMSDAEKKSQFEALGISFTDAAGFQNLVERAFGDDAGATENMLARVRSMKELARESANSAATTYGYKMQKGDAAAPVAAPVAAPKQAPSQQAAPKAGTVRMTNGTKTFDVPAARVADAEKDGFRRVE